MKQFLNLFCLNYKNTKQLLFCLVDVTLPLWLHGVNSRTSEVEWGDKRFLFFCSPSFLRCRKCRQCNPQRKQIQVYSHLVLGELETRSKTYFCIKTVKIQFIFWGQFLTHFFIWLTANSEVRFEMCDSLMDFNETCILKLFFSVAAKAQLFENVGSVKPVSSGR